MPDHEDSLGGETLDGDAKADPAEQSLGDGHTMGGDTAAHSLGDQSTFGDANVDDELFDDGMELVDLSTRYTEEGVLGKGGFGEVILATDNRLERKVAIKRIQGKAARSKTAVQRFITEAKSIAALSHNNIVQIYDYGRATDGPFLIMECVQGGSLLDLCRKGPIALDEAVKIFSQVCDGLAKAHAAGIIHRDIKPANVLMTEDGIPKLTDFGLAKDDTADAGMTMEGAVIGTLDFMPPEQRQGAEFTDHRSDLWSLAATFYQMLTGKSPKVINIASIPPKLQSVIAKALEESKEDRFQSAMEMREAILQSHSGKMDTSRSLAEGECPQCATRNSPDHNFCRECSGKLQVSCLKCEQDMAIWDKGCGECGTQQAPLVEKALADLKEMRDQSERLLTNLDFKAAAEQSKVVGGQTDSRLQQYATWHEDFSARLGSSRKSEYSRLAQLLREALAHEQAYDYVSGLQTLEQSASSLMRTSVRGCKVTAHELTERLTTKQSRLKELEGIVREQVSKRKIDGLLIIVDELLSLKPHRPEVQKLKAQLEKRWRTMINQLLADGNAKGALAELESLKIHGLTREQVKLYGSTKAMVAAETELITLVKKANADGMINYSEVVELLPKTIRCLELNPNNSSVLKLKIDLLDRIQIDVKSFANQADVEGFGKNEVAPFPSDVFAHLPSELLAEYRRQNPQETCTLKIAERYLDDPNNTPLWPYEWIDIDAAETLSKCKGDLFLHGLTCKWIDVDAAEALAKCEERLFLHGLTSISLEVAEALARSEGGLFLDGLTSLSVNVAEALSKCEGGLFLHGLRIISLEVAEALAKQNKSLDLTGLTSISLEVAEALSKCKADLFLDGLTSISLEAAEALAKCEGDVSARIVRKLRESLLGTIAGQLLGPGRTLAGQIA